MSLVVAAVYMLEQNDIEEVIAAMIMVEIPSPLV
jgi:hypothetical protein